MEPQVHPSTLCSSNCLTRVTGRVWKYGDNVNTDVIFPGKYTYSLTDPAEMAKHALEDLDPAFVKDMRPGDIIVAGKNWGCGSSREQAVVCLKEAGVGAIVARSFARIYFRNAINYALPIATCDAVDSVESGDEITIDFTAGTVITPRATYTFPPFPPEVMAILEAGGLIPYTQQALKGV
ncbi:MAG: 3-isopropylmalate dehydratase small subunit [Anaerolineae bacterium]|nr:3-isopropylmalate dehydratase small subunit [Anaerolineae bacterium]